MAGTISIEFPESGFLFRMKGIDVLVDGAAVGSLAFGRHETFSCAPGSHVVRAVLRGILTRRSNTLAVEVTEGASVRVVGIYSRIFGTMVLKKA